MGAKKGKVRSSELGPALSTWHAFATFNLTLLLLSFILFLKNYEETSSETLSNLLRFPQLNKWWSQDLLLLSDILY